MQSVKVSRGVKCLVNAYSLITHLMKTNTKLLSTNDSLNYKNSQLYSTTTLLLRFGPHLLLVSQLSSLAMHLKKTSSWYFRFLCDKTTNLSQISKRNHFLRAKNWRDHNSVHTTHVSDKLCHVIWYPRSSTQNQSWSS